MVHQSQLPEEPLGIKPLTEDHKRFIVKWLARSGEALNKRCRWKNLSSRMNSNEEPSKNDYDSVVNLYNDKEEDDDNDN